MLLQVGNAVFLGLGFQLLLFPALQFLWIDPLLAPGKHRFLPAAGQLGVHFRQMLFHIHKGKQHKIHDRHDNIKQVERHGHKVHDLRACGYADRVHKSKLQNGGLITAGKGGVYSRLNRHDDGGPQQPFQAQAGLKFYTVKGVAQKRRNDVAVG